MQAKIRKRDWYSVSEYTSKKIIAYINGKLIVQIGIWCDYLAVYDESDLSKPLYYMNAPVAYEGYTLLPDFQTVQIGENTLIAVRINSVDDFGYGLYYF